MPRLPINYANSVIYKLCCNDPTITDIYVGSTTNFTKRKTSHKKRCYNDKAKEYNIYVYEFIRENGGWENWNMIEIIKCGEVKDKNELLKIERQYMDNLKATLNKKRPITTTEEKQQQVYEKNKKYREENKEKIKEKYEENKEKYKPRVKAYRQEHKEERNAYRREWREKNKERLALKQTEYNKVRRERYRLKKESMNQEQ